MARRSKKKISLAVVGTTLFAAGYWAQKAMKAYSEPPADKTGWENVAAMLKYHFLAIGPDGKTNTTGLMEGYGTAVGIPLLGVAMHKGASALGVNRALSSIPWVQV
jgi:hypothetical protein